VTPDLKIYLDPVQKNAHVLPRQNKKPTI